MGLSHDTVALKRPEVKPCQRLIKLRARRDAMVDWLPEAEPAQGTASMALSCSTAKARYWEPRMAR